MAFPTSGWPPASPSGRRSLRFYHGATATANWSDNAFLFVDDATSGTDNMDPTPMIRPGDVTTPVNVSSPMGAGPLTNLQADQRYPAVFSRVIRVINTGSNPLEFSFSAIDNASTAVHGVVAANSSREYRDRHEAGIAIRSALGTTFEVEVW